MRARSPDVASFVERDGVRVGYELYEGPDPTLLFAPQPAITHARSLKGVVPYLSRHFRVLVVDGRGNGRSDRPQEAEAYAPSELAADCIAAMDATEAQRTIVVSFSARAIVGLRLCLEHPERVEAAVFATPDLWPTDYYLRQLTRRDDGRLQLRADEQRLARVSRALGSPDVSEPALDEADRGLRLLRHGHRREHLHRQHRGTRSSTRDEALEMASRVTVPRLVLQNGGGSVGPKDASVAFANATGAELRVFEGLGPVVSSRWPVALTLPSASSRRLCGPGGRAAGRYTQLTGFACRGSSAFRMIWTTTGSNASAMRSERSVGQTSWRMRLVAFGA